ncbi:MAG: maf protein [Candidatus Brocadiaceae bacterium]|nr:maf protein [Candidatus Brocadiaceae bacterium]
MIRQAKPLVLASRSPRRILLLKQIGLSPEIVPSEIGEEIDQGSSPADNAMRLAHAKAMDVGRRLQNAIVIGADTIVVLDGKYLGLDGYLCAYFGF